MEGSIVTVWSNENNTAISDAYNLWKRECVHHLYCDFAFVLYDPIVQSYFAARDVTGTRPLYYTICNNEFYYSDDIGDLLIRSGIKKEPDIDTMRRVLHYSAIPYSDTMYRDIKRLPPGHSMTVDKDIRVHIERYWKPEEIKINENITEEEAKEIFLELFNQAIIERIDDLPHTAFDLSGGLDSSSVVSMVKQRYPKENICTVSQIYPNISKCDESVYIDSIEEMYDIDSIRVRADDLDYKDHYNLEYNYALDPYWPILVTHTTLFPVAQKLQERGVKHILTGQGGDELMAGNLYCLFDHLKQIRWIQLYKELKTVKRPFMRLKRYVFLPSMNEKSKKTIKKILQLFRFEQINNKKFIPEKNFQEICDQYSKDRLSFWHDINALTNTMRSLIFDTSAYSVVSKHYGINFHHPFLDRRLIEFMLSLPSKFKYREGVKKVLLRKAMETVLPEKIRQRQDKAEFTPVLKQQIDAIDLDELLSDAYLAKLGLIEQIEVDQLKEDYISGKMKTVVYFWKIINMEYWYRYNFVMNQEED